jgi:hypothetical protein
MTNYKEKLDYRQKLFKDMNIYSTNPNNLTLQEWYRKYMPFLPKQVLDIIPDIEKERQIIIKQEESLDGLKYLFK